MRLSAAAIATWMFFSPPEEEAPAEPPPLQLNPAPEPEGFTEVPDPYAEEVDEPPRAQPQPPARVEPEPEPELQPRSEPEPELQPPSSGPGRRSRLGIKGPPVWPPTWFSFGIGGSDESFSLGAGVTHFVIPYVGVGLELRNDVIFGVNGTYNSFTATPVVTLLVLPRRTVTPLLRGGFGLNAYNVGGVYGQFLAGGGVLFRFLKRYSAELGFDVVGDVPRDKYFENFFCEGGGQGCWLGLRPSVGIGVSFGGPG